MRDPVEKTLGSFIYRVTPLPASKGLRLLAVVGRSIAPGLAAIKAGGEAALARALQGLDENDLVTVCQTFAEATSYRGPAGSFQPLAVPGAAGAAPAMDAFDLHFAGDYEALFRWLEFCAEVNFGPLVEKLRALAVPAAPAGSPAAAP